MQPERFGARLHAAVRARGPLCVGIDPHPGLLASWGLRDDVTGLAAFSRTVIEALADRVAVVKPQSAFFERFGPQGVAVLESTIRQLREAGALVLLDVKRGDIGSTAAAYADAYLGPDAPMPADAITASPYLGFGSLAPMVRAAVERGAGLFVLALTSNPEGASVQRAVCADGRTVAQTIIDEVSQVNEGVQPLGDVGVVIGATVGTAGVDLSRLGGPVLAPGLGAQGGRPGDLCRVFGSALPAVLPSYSREVLSAGTSVAGLRAAAERALAECVTAIGVGEFGPAASPLSPHVAETADDR